MLKRTFIIVIILGLLSGTCCGDAEVAWHQTDSVRVQLDQIYHDCMDSQYENAIAVAEKLIGLYPDEPLPRFFLSTVYMYMLRSYWNLPVDGRYREIRDTFHRVSDQTVAVCERHQTDRALATYCQGAVLGTQALVYLQDKEWIKAYHRGKEGVALLEKTVELDPQNYDAYLGLGMFEYYCASLRGTIKILAWLVGFRGDKEKGLEYVERARLHGTYAEGPAQVFMAAAFLNDEEKLLDGLAIARDLRTQYPHNYLYIDYIVRGVRKLPLAQTDLGIELIEHVVKTPGWREQVKLDLPYDLDIVDYELARLLIKQNRSEEARVLLEELSQRRNEWNNLSVRIDLLLLSIYKQTDEDQKAEYLYRKIQNRAPIEDSLEQARLIYKGH
ncbi:hypothetical protein JXQ70_07530 [bacterium]|nr:hypothetical protein [bacterium]